MDNTTTTAIAAAKNDYKAALCAQHNAQANLAAIIPHGTHAEITRARKRFQETAANAAFYMAILMEREIGA